MSERKCHISNTDENIISIECDREIDECRYAFYIFVDDKKVYTQWYTESNKFSYKVTESGIYYAVAFYKVDEEIIDTVSSGKIEVYVSKDNKIEEKPFSISIFGSCVSRDVLEYQKEKNIKLGSYIARQSMISAVQEPICISLDDIHTYPHSEFKEKMLYYDWNKKAFEELNRNKSDFLLIDLIDERFELKKIGRSFVTYSTEMMTSNLDSEKYKVVKRKIKKFFEKKYVINEKNVKTEVKKFCTEIKKIYSTDRIILHECYGTYSYVSNQGTIKKFDNNSIGYYQRMNTYYKYLYNILKSNFPGCHVIDVSSKYIGDENHKWGIAPIHYQAEYYIEVLRNIIEINESIVE